MIVYEVQYKLNINKQSKTFKKWFYVVFLQLLFSSFYWLFILLFLFFFILHFFLIWVFWVALKIFAVLLLSLLIPVQCTFLLLHARIHLLLLCNICSFRPVNNEVIDIVEFYWVIMGRWCSKTPTMWKRQWLDRKILLLFVLS